MKLRAELELLHSSARIVEQLFESDYILLGSAVFLFAATVVAAADAAAGNAVESLGPSRSRMPGGGA